jgi:hypothetical protein
VQALIQSAQCEVDRLAVLLTGEFSRTKFKNYQMDNFNVSNYLEDKEEVNSERYLEEVCEESMKAFSELLNKAKLLEFEKPPVSVRKPGDFDNVIQVVAGCDGLWLRKTTSYHAFGVLSQQCPEHIAKPENGGYYGSDDHCPEDCDFEPTFKGYGPGTRTIYDVFVRTFPKLVVS